jgi:hypothetical protein
MLSTRDRFRFFWKKLRMGAVAIARHAVPETFGRSRLRQLARAWDGGQDFTSESYTVTKAQWLSDVAPSGIRPISAQSSLSLSLPN